MRNTIYLPSGFLLAFVCCSLFGFAENARFNALPGDIPAKAGTSPQPKLSRPNPCPPGGAPFFLSHEVAIIGGTACVKVLTQSYANIAAFQYSIAFDTSILAFSGIQAVNNALVGLSANDNFNLQFAAEGILTVAYDDTGGGALTLPDSTLLYEICFTARAVGASPVSFSGTPTPIVAFDDNLAEIPFTGEDGSVEVLLCQDVSVVVDTSICAGESVVVGSTAYTDSGRYETTIATAAGCDSTILLNLSVETVGFGFPPAIEICAGEQAVLQAPDTIRVGFPNGPLGQSVVLGPGAFSIALENSINGCAEVQQVVVQELPPPDVSILGDTQVCGLGETQLTAVGGTAYSWNTGATTAQISVGPGLYSVTATDAGGCVGEASIAVEGDTEAPVFVFCPDSAGGVINYGELTVPVHWTEPVAVDNCGDDNITITQTHQSGDGFGLGATTVMYTATDEAGNSAACAFELAVESSADLTFYVDTAGYTFSEDTFCVPVRVLNFEGVTGFQFTMVATDTLLSRIFDIQAEAALSGGNGLDFFAVDEHTYTLIWVDDSGLGLDLPDSTAVFTLKMIINGQPGDCVPLTFDNQPANIEAVQNGLGQVIPTVIDGDICVRPSLNIGGRIYRIDNAPIGNAEVTLYGPDTLLDITTPAGFYAFDGQPVGEDYTIVPWRDFNHRDGISIFDLVAINQHILFINLITDPYLLVAADVNSSQSVTIADLVEIRDLILGVILEFPSSPSWKFIPVSYQFPTPSFPWQEVFPQQIELMSLTDDSIAEDFYGIKIGDINLDATGNMRGAGPASAQLLTPEQAFEAGETIELPIHIMSREALAGFQFELEFDRSLAEFIKVEAGGLPGLSLSQSFAYNRLHEGRLPVVWYAPGTDALEKSMALFTLTFKAKKAGTAGSLLKLAESGIPGLAVTDGLEALALSLQVDEALGGRAELQGEAFTSLSCIPNPFSGQASIAFGLRQADWVSFSIYDMNGRLVSTDKRYYEAGRQQYTLESQLLRAKGVYTCRLKTSDGLGVIRLARQ